MLCSAASRDARARPPRRPTRANGTTARRKFAAVTRVHQSRPSARSSCDLVLDGVVAARLQRRSRPRRSRAAARQRPERRRLQRARHPPRRRRARRAARTTLAEATRFAVTREQHRTRRASSGALDAPPCAASARTRAGSARASARPGRRPSTSEPARDLAEDQRRCRRRPSRARAGPRRAAACSLGDVAHVRARDDAGMPIATARSTVVALRELLEHRAERRVAALDQRVRRGTGSRRRRSGPSGASATARSSSDARRVEVLPLERRPAGGREAPARALGELGGARVVGVELAPVARGLLEVVADDLVLLVRGSRVASSQSAKRSCSSARDGLRQRLVGRVADQEVAEAEGVVARRSACDRAARAPCGRARAAGSGRRRAAAPARAR